MSTSSVTSSPRWAAQLAAGIREEWPWLVGGQLLVGLGLLSLATFGVLPGKGLGGFVGTFLAVYAGLILLQHPQFDLVGERLKQRLMLAVASSGVGFYGVVSLSRFLQLELHDLLAAANEFEFSRSQLGGLVREWVVGFSVQSLMNSIEAMLWPFRLAASQGWQTALAVFTPLWLLYRFGSWVFPELHALIEAEDAAAEDEDEDIAAATKAAETGPPPPR